MARCFRRHWGARRCSSPAGAAASSTAAGRLGFAAPHGLGAGQAVSCAGEIRFVAAIVDASTVQLNAPFTVLPGTGAALGAAVTYVPATELPSASVFDYWDPATAVQRLLCGAAVDQMEIQVNGDYHEFHFSGLAQDVLDSSSFSSANVGQLQSFPAEPAMAAFDYSIVPGNMGQAWLGTSPAQFLTITSASIVLKNQLDTRSKEFGSNLPRAISPGQRSVTAAFELFSQDDDATTGLYQAARQQSPISVMFQLGEPQGQVMGVYLQSVIPEVPEFDDSQNRLQWKFRPSRAQGTVDNEIAVAFAIDHDLRKRKEVESRVARGVTFTVARMSFGRRVELMRRVRELAGEWSSWRPGKAPGEKMDAALLQAEIDRLLRDVGIAGGSGLEVDGVAATPELLAEAGPENLFREALAAVRAETGLSEAERKN